MFGTGPEALQQILFDNWQESRTGRPDVPPLVTDGSGNPSTDPDDISQPGEVMVLANRERVAANHAVVDEIRCYMPDGDPGTWEDQGFNETRDTEHVFMEIDLTNRTDPSTGERLTAKERMVGDRDDASFSGGDPPYPGILGEVRYIYELVRRGYEEFDRVEARPLGGTIKNSNATYRISWELTVLARNTVQ